MCGVCRLRFARRLAWLDEGRSGMGVGDGELQNVAGVTHASG